MDQASDQDVQSDGGYQTTEGFLSDLDLYIPDKKPGKLSTNEKTLLEKKLSSYAQDMNNYLWTTNKLYRVCALGMISMLRCFGASPQYSGNKVVKTTTPVFLAILQATAGKTQIKASPRPVVRILKTIGEPGSYEIICLHMGTMQTFLEHPMTTAMVVYTDSLNHKVGNFLLVLGEPLYGRKVVIGFSSWREREKMFCSILKRLLEHKRVTVLKWLNYSSSQLEFKHEYFGTRTYFQERDVIKSMFKFYSRTLNKTLEKSMKKNKKFFTMQRKELNISWNRFIKMETQVKLFYYEAALKKLTSSGEEPGFKSYKFIERVKGVDGKINKHNPNIKKAKP